MQWGGRPARKKQIETPAGTFKRYTRAPAAVDQTSSAAAGAGFGGSRVLGLRPPKKENQSPLHTTPLTRLHG